MRVETLCSSFLLVKKKLFLNVLILTILSVNQEKQEENELRALPPPSAAQLKAVDAAVMETVQQHGISEEDFRVRQAVVIKMEEIIKRKLSGWTPVCRSLGNLNITFVS